MKRASLISLLSAPLGLFARHAIAHDLSIRQAYQTMKPITSKNIGRNRLKSRSKYMPHQGERECARRRRQMAKLEARRGGS